MTTSASGGDFLAKKSNMTQLRQALPSLKDILIVEDETFDADRLKATLHVMFGYELEIRRARSLATALDCVLARLPDLVFLDDHLKPADTASHTIPVLRHAKYDGPLIMIGGQVTRHRRAELMALGAADVIHKDDVDSVRIAEALARAFKIQ